MEKEPFTQFYGHFNDFDGHFEYHGHFDYFDVHFEYSYEPLKLRSFL